MEWSTTRLLWFGNDILGKIQLNSHYPILNPPRFVSKPTCATEAKLDDSFP